VLYRPYTPQDFDALYAIEERSFKPPLRFGRRYMRQLVSRAKGATWIAEEDERPIGFAIVEWSEHKDKITAYVQTIEVSPEARGRGVGRALLGRIEDSARLAGARVIWLHVDAENAAAIRLYEACGYRCEGRQEDYYPLGGAAFIYVKRLGPAICYPCSGACHRRMR
jgi:ribosomal protein S18 acetylase RimI-like enzyme